MILNYPKFKKVMILLVFAVSFSAFSQTADYKVQHLQDDVARSGGTNTSFTAVSSLNNAIALPNNNRKSNAGLTNQTASNLDGDDMAGARQLTATNTLTYYRESGSLNSNMRFNTSIWEYVGPVGGANEMIVRGRYAVSLNGTTNSVTQALSGITNANNCIPFITGIMNNSTADDADSGTAIAYLENASTLRVQKGSNGNNVTVYITVVEFTGSNWTVLHGDSGSVSADTGTITLMDGSDGTGTATNVSAWSDAIIFSHHRGDTGASGTNDALADNWPVMDPGSNNQRVDWTFHGNHDSAGTNRQFVHVLNNSGLNVTRYQNTSNAAGETTINITSAGLTNTNEALIVGSSRTNGGGQAYGRGWRNYYLNSTTQAAHWTHRSGNTMAHEIQIIDLVGLNTTTTCGSTVNTFPYSEDFESGFGLWSQDATDTTDWTRQNGGTPSNFTGPSAAGSNSWYLFTEATGNSNNIANLESPCFDLTGLSNPDFTFSYHMFGANMGTLNVDISTDGGVTYPTNLWTQSGEVQTSNAQAWNSVTLDLSAYIGQIVKLRFNGNIGGGYRSDMAIDNLSLIDTTPAPEINITGLGNSILDGDITPITTDDTDFGSVITVAGSNANIFTIENLGTADLTLSNPVLTGDTADFIVTVNPTSPVSASGNTTFTIIFDPTVDGVRTAVVSIANNDSDENPYTFTITGTGYTPAPEINITGLGNTIVDGDSTPSVIDDTDFGSVDITIGTQVNTFTIENIGTLGLNLTGASPYVAISGTNAADFSVTAIPSNSIATSGSTTFAITFNPTTVGLKTATLTIANDDSDENPYNFDIQGTGTTTTFSQVVVSVTWPNWSSENTVEIYSPSGTLISTITDPTGTGNSSYSTTVNLGCLEDLNNYYFIMYDSADDGWDGTDNITITVGGTTVVNQNGNTATSGGTTVFFNVSGGTSAAEISVTGNSFEIIDGDTTPATNDNTNFGKVQFGVETTVNSFSIENQSCSTSLNLTGASPYIVISGADAADFSVSTTPTTPVLASGNTAFAITFNPSTAGIKTATVTIANDDSDESAYNFDITGESIAPLTKGPGGVKTDLKLWLTSTAGLGYSDGGSISTWSDQGLASDATVNTVGQEPTFKDNSTDNINFNPVVDFNNSFNPVPKDSDYSYDDTSTEFLEGTGGFYSQDIFMVAIPDTTVDSSFGSMDLFCGDEDISTNAEDATGLGFGAYSIRFTSEVISYAIGTTTDIGGGVQDGYGVTEAGSGTYTNVGIINTRNNLAVTQQELYFNAKDIENTQNDIPDFSNVDNSRYWIGRSEGWEASTDARIAEIITYSSRQSDVDLTDKRNRIQSYLAIKYGITLGVNGTSQDYVDSDGTVIWDQSANSGYNYDIAGIGRDDASDLNQKQSSSVNNATDITGPIEGILTIGLTDIYNTNNENKITNAANTFNDKDFLVWGNNGADLDLAASVINVDMSAGIAGLTTPVTFTGMQRVWKVIENGSDISKAKVSIPQNAIRNITPPGSYLMFISNTGIFDPTADYRVLTPDGSGNLETTYDFDGTKYITFGYAPQVVVERSVYFDGAVDYIDMEDALDLNTSNFTISSWIKRGSGSADTSILSKRDAAYTEGYDYKINAAGRFEMSWKNGSTQTITSDVVIPENQWHHVAIIYSGGTANLYIDGVLDKTASLSAPVNTTQSFYIAAAGKSTPTAYFKGNIDEVRVWDTALTVDQLRYVMNQEIVENSTFTDGVFVPTSISKNDVSTIPWTNLAGYYPMSIYTYTNTNDESGNGNQGALRNLNTVDYQTAPLPYKSTQNGNWDTNSTWLNGSEQTIPGATSIVDPNITVDWNIVETNHNLTMDNSSLPGTKNNDRYVLGLILGSNTVTLDGDSSTNSGNAVTITHYLKIDGTLDLEGESQLIQTDGSDLAVSSSGYIERDQQGTENSFTYNYWSAPVSLIGAGTNNAPFTIADILKDGTDPANPLPPNFAYSYTHADGPLSTPRKISTYWIWNFVNQGNAYANWNWIGESNNLNVTEGYTMKGTSNTGAISENQNYVFVGKPNNVLNGATELIHTTFGVPGNPLNPEISLTGNPFPSAIDANRFITDNLTSTDGQLLFWEHWGGGTHNVGEYQGGYATRTIATGVPAVSHPDVDQTGTGSKAPGQYITVAQGFFVTSSAVGGNVVFKNSQRVFEKEGTTSSLFFRGVSSKNNENNTERNGLEKMTLRLGFESPNGYHRQIAAVFNIDGATDDIEKGYDGHASDILSNDAFFIQDDKYYVIQAYGDFNEEREIPIVISIDEDNDGGLQKIMIDELENIPNKLTIYIKDNLSGETHNLKNNTFEIYLSSGTYKDRFSIVFKPQSSLSVEDEVIKNGITAYMNNSTSTIKITNNTDAEIQKVVLYNALGQQSKTWLKRLTERKLNLMVQNLSTGVYILKIETNKVNINKKLIIE